MRKVSFFGTNVPFIPCHFLYTLWLHEDVFFSSVLLYSVNCACTNGHLKYQTIMLLKHRIVLGFLRFQVNSKNFISLMGP